MSRPRRNGNAVVFHEQKFTRPANRGDRGERRYMSAIQALNRQEAESPGYHPVRVLIADDHTLIRQGLIGLLGDVFPAWQFREAVDLVSVERELGDADIELLVIDLGMPGMGGRASLRELRVKYPDLKVVVLTGRDDHATILECLAAGVHGYVLKADAAGQMLLAVRTILAGGIYVPSALSQIVHDAGVGHLTSTPAEPARVPGSPAGLTGRQQEVLNLLAEGRSTKDIARRLALGVGTVKVHLTGVYRALGARNRTEAVAKAVAIRAVEPTSRIC
jgi:DNA-binding NarL/FixJ family response regulator